jgi:predicted ABC-type ATPase
VNRDEFYDALARNGLVALSGSEHVSAYTRISKTGKKIHVSAYTRDPGKMSNTDLFSEYKDLSAGKAELPPTAQRNRLAQITTEIRKRQNAGSWGPGKEGANPKPEMGGAAAAPSPGNNWKGEGRPNPRGTVFDKNAKADAAKAADKAATSDKAPDKPESSDAFKDAKPDANGWTPGAEHATNKFLDEKHAKQSKEPHGVYTPSAQEQQEWDARMDTMLSAPLNDGQIGDLTAGPSTADNHLERNPDGSMSFSKERQAFHKRLIAAFLDGYAPQEKPRYHMMGGGPASGKSVMEKANPEIAEGHALINADEVKGMLPEAWNEDGTLNAALAHEESSHVAKLIQQEAFARKVGVTLDGTGDGGEKGVRKKLEQARRHGYEVHGYYVSTDVDTAIQRAKQRASKPPYRSVPDKLLRKTHKDVSQTFPTVMDEFDSAKLYDSSTREGVLVGEKQAGGRFEVKDADAWKQFLDKAHAD